INFMVYKGILYTRGTKKQKAIMLLGVFFNLGLIFYYKYFDFFIENVNTVFGSDYTLYHILLPLGISFFTFQQISFIVDTYRGQVGVYSFIDYALFVTFFPQLIAGPIVTHAEMIPQFQDRQKKFINIELCTKGMLIFILGLAKKVLLADTFGKGVDWGYANIPSLDATNTILVMLFYALQLYFDFSGYCDMARGIGYFFGVEIPINFNSPYKAVDIVDFWKRWHITLNRFMTQYVYIPLGGNRKGKVRTYLNLFAIFLVSGIWHGAAWTYIVWGVMHGIVYVLTRVCWKWVVKVPKLIRQFVTFVFFNISIVYFHAASIAQANQMMAQLGKHQFGKVNLQLTENLNMDEFWYVLKILHLDQGTYSKAYVGLGLLFVSLLLVFCGKNVNELAESFQPKAWNAVALTGLLIWCVISLSGVSTFLYFNF
ncbi:MAG: MBOAT family protein, partial [Lachnospiraceae bacterium]|nr:MBOAT family protein [Lachnospiraceae bacterium]